MSYHALLMLSQVKIQWPCGAIRNQRKNQAVIPHFSVAFQPTSIMWQLVKTSLSWSCESQQWWNCYSLPLRWLRVIRTTDIPSSPRKSLISCALFVRKVKSIYISSCMREIPHEVLKPHPYTSMCSHSTCRQKEPVLHLPNTCVLGAARLELYPPLWWL